MYKGLCQFLCADLTLLYGSIFFHNEKLYNVTSNGYFE